MNTAAYASAPLSMASLRLRRLRGRWDVKAKTRGSEPRSRQNIIGDQPRSLRWCSFFPPPTLCQRVQWVWPTYRVVSDDASVPAS